MRLMTCCAVLLLAACGQSGDLYLPDRNPAPAPAPAAAPTAEPEKKPGPKAEAAPLAPAP